MFGHILTASPRGGGGRVFSFYLAFCFFWEKRKKKKEKRRTLPTSLISLSYLFDTGHAQWVSTPTKSQAVSCYGLRPLLKTI